MDLINKTQNSPITTQGNTSTTQNDLSFALDKKLGDLKSVMDISPQQSTGNVSGSQDLKFLLAEAIKYDASDLHLTVGYKVILRINGVLKNFGANILTDKELEEYVKELLKNRSDLNFNTVKEVDLTYTLGNRRFRVNIFRQMGTYSIVFRIIPDRILTLEELGQPNIIKDFTKFSNGLVLVTGPTGSGKSTTLASLLNLINITQQKHIITLEDPITLSFTGNPPISLLANAL